MKKLILGLAVAATLAVTSAQAVAELALPSMFTSGAVLQQEMPVPVWGTADPGAEVTVTFAGQTKSTKADADGNWLVKLDPLKLNKEPATMAIASGDEKIDVENVLVGEVWFCSGQSNMEWRVSQSEQPDFIDPDKLPTVRHIKVPHVRAGEPAADFDGAWQVCSKDTVGDFTAVGFNMAVVLTDALNGTPIGLVGCNWGGTRIEPWTPPAGLEMVEELADLELKDTSTMYNGMVAAVQPYAIRGAIWYQGESNGSEGETYLWKKKAMVGGWRKTWDQGDFPFYLVQLADFRESENAYDGSGWAKLREAQLNAVREIPKVGMAVICDVGEPNDIHPRNKYTVGQRLAYWALANDYGKKDLVYSGPLFTEAKVDGDKIVCSFEHTGTGLMAARKEGPRDFNPPKPVDKLEGFGIAGEDKVWHPATAVIDGDKVVVSSPEVKAPVAVRYGFTMNPSMCNLYNKEGLPASPFRSDDW